MDAATGELFKMKFIKQDPNIVKFHKKYKFSRAKWYEAKMLGNQQAAFAWCVKQFGPEPTNTDAWTRWYFNVDRTFRFRDEKDYVMFILRWS
jgi:hypothetical protein